MSAEFDPGPRLRRLAARLPGMKAGLAEVTNRGMRRRRRSRLVGAVSAAAALVVVVSVGAQLLRSPEPAPLPLSSTTTSAPTTTPPPTTNTTEPPAAATTVATTIVATTTPARPAPDPDVIVIAESAHEIGVQIGGLGPFTLNPFLESAPDWRIINYLDPAIQRGAWRPGVDGDPVADLVEDLPTPDNGTATVGADGNLRLEYRVRERSVWSDGTPVTAADFEMTLRILQEPGLPIREDWRILHAGIVSFESAEDYTFTVTLNQPLGIYRSLFPVVVPAHAVAPLTFADQWNEQIWPSAGPFTLARFERFQRPLAGTMTLRRNGETDGPSTVRIDFYQRDDRGDSLAIPAFRDGGADVLGPDAAWEYLFDGVPDGVAASGTQPFIWEVLFIQRDEQRLIANPESQVDRDEVRRAIVAALDPIALEAVGGRIFSLVEYFMPGTANPSGGWASIGYDPSGVDEPVSLVYSSTAGMLTMDIGRTIIDLLNEAGFDVTADFDQDSSAAFDRFAAGDFEVFAIRLVRLPGSEELARLLAELRPGAADGEFPGLPDMWAGSEAGAEFADLLDEFDAELDPDRRKHLLIQAENLLVKELFLVPLVMRNGDRWAHHPDRVTGPANADGPEAFLSNLAEWRRVDG